MNNKLQELIETSDELNKLIQEEINKLSDEEFNILQENALFKAAKVLSGVTRGAGKVIDTAILNPVAKTAYHTLRSADLMKAQRLRSIKSLARNAAKNGKKIDKVLKKELEAGAGRKVTSKFKNKQKDVKAIKDAIVGTSAGAYLVKKFVDNKRQENLEKRSFKNKLANLFKDNEEDKG